MKKATILAGLLLSAIPLVGAAQEGATLPRTPAPEGAEAYFIAPQDGDTVSSPVTVVFGLRGIGVAPAGVQMANTGHHHLLIDLEEPESLSLPLPTTDQVVHFGGGQTETQIELEPGQHTLRMVLGDHLHIPHDPPVMSEIITITVE